MISVKQHILTTIVVSALLISGCASTTKTQPGILLNLISEANNSASPEHTNAEQLYPQYLQPYVEQNGKSGLRDQVLVNMQAGVTALEQGDFHITRRLMEDAYNRIETVYANNDAAKAARSNYVEEANKDFKGEPYERAMVGYYLGISDMFSGDLQSAKASFSWGEYQDTLSANEEFQGDMSSLIFLRGWAKHCSGELQDAKNDFIASGVNPPKNANLLLLVESGDAPVKFAEGEHSEKLKFKAADYSQPARLAVNFYENRFVPKTIEDLAFQASTRGGRHIDAVLAGKAEFKDTTKNVSDGAFSGAIMATTISQASSYSGDYNTAYDASVIGAALGVISLFANAMSENTVPEADTRQWNNLPQFIHAQALHINDATELSEVKLYSNNKQVAVSAKPIGQCYLAWHRVGA